MLRSWLSKHALLFSTHKWTSYKEVQFQKWEYETNFMRSSGPGGQSVNTTNSKAQLRLKLDVCSILDQNIMKNLKQKHANNITKTNQLVVRSQTFKSQGKNLDDCFERLQKIIFQCSIVKQQKSTQPFVQPQQNRQKRLQSKKKKSVVKANRQNKYSEY